MRDYDLEELYQLESPIELHEIILHYNWDDGIEIPRAVINNKNCDKGTALMVYWLACPGYYCQYENRDKVSGQYEIASYDLIDEIEQKYRNGFYQNRSILFNPRYDSREGMDGVDHTQMYDDLPKKRKIPDEMFESSIPDLEWEAMGRPIKTIKKVDYKELFKSLDDEISKLEMDEE